MLYVFAVSKSYKTSMHSLNLILLPFMRWKTIAIYFSVSVVTHAHVIDAAYLNKTMLKVILGCIVQILG